MFLRYFLFYVPSCYKKTRTLSFGLLFILKLVLLLITLYQTQNYSMENFFHRLVVCMSI